MSARRIYHLGIRWAIRAATASALRSRRSASSSKAWLWGDAAFTCRTATDAAPTEEVAEPATHGMMRAIQRLEIEDGHDSAGASLSQDGEVPHHQRSDETYCDGDLVAALFAVQMAVDGWL
jgi:hypothetical protein